MNSIDQRLQRLEIGVTAILETLQARGPSLVDVPPPVPPANGGGAIGDEEAEEGKCKLF